MEGDREMATGEDRDVDLASDAQDLGGRVGDRSSEGFLEGSIFDRMSKVMADVGFIGKNQRNEHFNFQFRGIDDVLNALHGPLTKHGVFYVPKVQSCKIEAGAKQFKAELSVVLRFYGPRGDYVDAGPVVAEGMDTQDKASTKALQLAVKYVLLQTFCIPTEEQREEDPDRHGMEWKGAKARTAQTQKAAPKPSEVSQPAAEAPSKPQATDSALATDRQKKRLAILAQDLGWDDDRRHKEAGVDSFTKLTMKQADELHEKWQKFLIAKKKAEREGTSSSIAPSQVNTEELTRCEFVSEDGQQCVLPTPHWANEGRHEFDPKHEDSMVAVA